MAEKSKSKYDFSDVLEDVKATLKKDKQSTDSVFLASDMPDVSKDPKDYVVMPSWWEEHYGILGLPFGKFVQIAGDSDTGKTSLCITAMKAAQDQGFAILYVETELKTSKTDLLEWGVDPAGVMLVQTNVIEKAYDGSFRYIESFFSKRPKGKLLYIFDSIGNNISMRDDDLDLINEKQKPGGKSTTNRQGLSRLVGFMNNYPMACLLVNYEYDNIGSVGKIQAGGKALKFYTMLGIQTQRTGDWTKKQAGQDVKVGTKVRWTTFKNHFQKAAKDSDGNIRLLRKSVNLQISADGLEVDAKANEKEREKE